MAFEGLDKALARQNMRLDPNLLKPAEAKGLDDIRRLLVEFDPSHLKVSREITISAIMEAKEDGKRNVYSVDAKTKSKSRREMILEGMDVIKKQMAVTQIGLEKSDEVLEINGKVMKPASFVSNGANSSWIDPLIKQWLGAHREGLMICWNLDGYKYEYDIYNHKLSRSQNEN